MRGALELLTAEAASVHHGENSRTLAWLPVLFARKAATRAASLARQSVLSAPTRV